jgi:hypothetical protein
MRAQQQRIQRIGVLGVQRSPRVSGALGAVMNSKQALLACSALVGVSLLVPQIAEAKPE